MVLAAGLGTRMRPFNGAIPKPLVKVGNKALIDYVLDRLALAGVERAVVNVHHMADQIERHLAGRQRPRIVFSDERSELLGTAGGIVKALPQLGDGPFFLVNSDTIWIDGVTSNLARLAAAFDPATDGWAPAARADDVEHRLYRPWRLQDGGRRKARPARRARGRAVRLCGRRDPDAGLLRRNAGRPVLDVAAVRPGDRGASACAACGSKACGCMSARPRPSAPPKPPSSTARRRSSPRASARSLPPCWEGLGRGVVRGTSPEATPTPDPSPQGGGEHIERAASGGAEQRRVRTNRQVVYDSACPAPRVFTIPASTPFVPTLIDALLGGQLVPGFPASDDPLALANATLYLPTRRACRLVRDSFLDIIKRDAAILPRIVPIGDVDEDEIAFARAATGGVAADALTLPDDLGGLERRLLLAQLVLTGRPRRCAHGRRRAAGREYAGGCARARRRSRAPDGRHDDAARVRGIGSTIWCRTGSTNTGS